MTKNTWKVISKPQDKKNKNWLLYLLSKNRGLTTKNKLQEFLNPKIEQITATKLSDVKKAVNRVSGAINKKEKIIVYSDYDADGICATAIMWETLYDLGANVTPYVPHRLKEGYGLSNDAISTLAKDKVNLIITVDHGVTALKQVEHAKKLKIDVVITDHHVLPQSPPKAHALVHTTSLCGAGVSWLLCWEIVKKLNPSYKKILLDKLELTAIATIADLVPLTGANRAIVKLGLEKIAKTKRPGIRALMNAASINSSIGTYEIGHILAPRINAMGRIEHGLDALRLLCAKSKSQAEKLAQLLTKTNSKRQDLTTKGLEVATSLVNEDQLIGVVAHDSLHEGVIGLVASRLVEAFGKPMIVIAKGQAYSKGSARSIAGFNMVEAIRSHSEFLVDGGGHPMAAGFTIKTQYIESFSQKINSYAQSRISEDLLTPIIYIECELELKDLSHKNWQTIQLFQPFGVTNQAPIFITRNMLVEDVRAVGSLNNHLKLLLNGISAIGFNMGNLKSQMRPGYTLDVVYALDEDKYNGQGSIQLKIKDFKIAES